MHSVCSNDLNDDEQLILDWSRQNTETARDVERNIKKKFDAVIGTLDRYMMASRQRRLPYYMFSLNPGSSSSLNQSRPNLFSAFGSHSTLAETQSVVTAQSECQSKMRKSVLERVEKATGAKKTSKPISKVTSQTNVALIPAGFERDLLEFHKYNDF